MFNLRQEKGKKKQNMCKRTFNAKRREEKQRTQKMKKDKKVKGRENTNVAYVILNWFNLQKMPHANLCHRWSAKQQMHLDDEDGDYYDADVYYTVIAFVLET